MRGAALVLLCAACSDRALPFPVDAPADLAQADLAAPCRLVGRLDGALSGTVDVGSGCAVFGLEDVGIGMSAFSVETFAARAASPLLSVDLVFDGPLSPSTRTERDASSGSVRLSSGGSVWAAGPGSGSFTLTLTFVGDPQPDANGRPNEVVHGSFEASLPAVGKPSAPAVGLHLSF